MIDIKAMAGRSDSESDIRLIERLSNDLENKSIAEKRNICDQVRAIVAKEPVQKALCSNFQSGHMCWEHLISRLIFNAKEEIEKVITAHKKFRNGQLKKVTLTIDVFSLVNDMIGTFLNNCTEDDHASVKLVIGWLHSFMKRLKEEDDVALFILYNPSLIHLLKLLSLRFYPNKDLVRFSTGAIKFCCHVLVKNEKKMTRSHVSETLKVLLKFVCCQYESQADLHKLHDLLSPIIAEQFKRKFMDPQILGCINCLFRTYAFENRHSLCSIGDKVAPQLIDKIHLDRKDTELYQFFSFLLCLHQPTFNETDALLSSEYLDILSRLYQKVICQLQSIIIRQVSILSGYESKIELDTLDLISRVLVCTFEIHDQLPLTGEIMTTTAFGQTQAKRPRLSTANANHSMPISWPAFFTWFRDCSSFSTSVAWQQIIGHVITDFFPTISANDFLCIVNELVLRLENTKSGEVAQALLPLITRALPRFRVIKAQESGRLMDQWKWSHLADLCLKWIMVASLQDVACELLATMVHLNMLSEEYHYKLQYSLRDSLKTSYVFRAGACTLLLSLLNHVDFDENMPLDNSDSDKQYPFRYSVVDELLGVDANVGDTVGIGSLRLNPLQPAFTGPSISRDYSIRMLCECTFITLLDRPHLFQSGVLQLYDTLNRSRDSFPWIPSLEFWNEVLEGRDKLSEENKDHTTESPKIIPQVMQMLLEKLKSVAETQTFDVGNVNIEMQCTALRQNWCFLWGLTCYCLKLHITNPFTDIEPAINRLKDYSLSIGDLLAERLLKLEDKKESCHARAVGDMCKFCSFLLESCPKGAPISPKLSKLLLDFAFSRSKSSSGVPSRPASNCSANYNSLPDTNELEDMPLYRPAAAVSPAAVSKRKLSSLDGSDSIEKLRSRSLSLLCLVWGCLEDNTLTLELERALELDTVLAQNIFNDFISMRPMPHWLFKLLWQIAKHELKRVKDAEKDNAIAESGLIKATQLASHPQFTDIREDFLNSLKDFDFTPGGSLHKVHLSSRLICILANDKDIRLNDVFVQFIREESESTCITGCIESIINAGCIQFAWKLCGCLKRVEYSSLQFEVLLRSIYPRKSSSNKPNELDASLRNSLIFLRACHVLCTHANFDVTRLVILKVIQSVVVEDVSVVQVEKLFYNVHRHMRRLVHSHFHEILTVSLEMPTWKWDLFPFTLVGFSSLQDCIRWISPLLFPVLDDAQLEWLSETCQLSLTNLRESSSNEIYLWDGILNRQSSSVVSRNKIGHFLALLLLHINSLEDQNRVQEILHECLNDHNFNQLHVLFHAIPQAWPQFLLSLRVNILQRSCSIHSCALYDHLIMHWLNLSNLSRDHLHLLVSEVSIVLRALFSNVVNGLSFTLIKDLLASYSQLLRNLMNCLKDKRLKIKLISCVATMAGVPVEDSYITPFLSLIDENVIDEQSLIIPLVPDNSVCGDILRKQIKLRKVILPSIEEELNSLLSLNEPEVFITKSYIQYLTARFQSNDIKKNVKSLDLIHQFFCLLSQISNDESELKVDICKLIAIWELADPGRVVMACHLSKQTCTSLNDLVIHLLYRSYFHSDHILSILSGNVLDTLLQAKVIELPHNLHHLHLLASSSLPCLYVHENTPSCILALNSWVPVSESSTSSPVFVYESWVTAVAISIASSLPSSPLLSVNIINSVQVTERDKLLPHLMEAYILTVPDSLALFRNNINQIVKAQILMDQICVLQLLTTVLIHLMNSEHVAQKLETHRGFCVLQSLNVDYAAMSKYCSSAELFYHSAYFSQIAADCNRLGMLEDGSVMFKRKNHLQVLPFGLQSTIRDNLLKVSLNEKDSDLLHGLGNDALNRLPARLFLARKEQKWHKLISLQSENSSAALTDSLLDIVQLSSLTNLVAQSPQQMHNLRESQSACVWRLGQWTQIQPPKKLCSNFDENVAACLKSVSEGEDLFVKSLLTSTWEKESNSLFLKGSSVFKQDSIGRYKILSTVEQFCQFTFNCEFEALNAENVVGYDELDCFTVARSFMQALFHRQNCFLPKQTLVACINKLIEKECSLQANVTPIQKSYRLVKEWEIDCFKIRKELSPCLQQYPAFINACLLSNDGEYQSAEYEFGKIIRSLSCLDQKIKESGHLRLLSKAYSQMGMLMSKTKGVAANTICFEQGVRVSDKLSANGLSDPEDDQVIGKSLYLLAEYKHEQYKALHDYSSSNNFESKRRIVAGLGRHSAAVKFYSHQKKNQLAQPESMALLIAGRDGFKMGEEDNRSVLETMKREENLLEECICDSVKCMVVNDKHDHLIFRVLSLLLENSDNDQLISQLNKIIFKVPTYKWLTIWPQLVSFISLENHASSPFQKLINQLVVITAQEHPYHTIYNLIAVADILSPKGERKLKDPSALIRADGAQDILTKKLSLNKAIVKDMIKLGEAYHELAFVKIRQVTLSSMCKKLASIKGNRCAVVALEQNVEPSTRYDQIITVVSFDSKVTLLSGKNKAIAVDCIGSDGKKYRQVVKGDDDLRQDALMEQLFEVTNQLLRRKNKQLQLNTYMVVALTPKCGVLQWCAGTITLGNYLCGNKAKGSGAHYKYYPSEEYHYPAVFHKMLEVAKKTAQERMSTFKEICENFPPVFRHFFYERFTDPAIWFTRTKAYTRSVALSSMVGEIIGLGDRHLENIMINTETGQVVHIDLGIAFEQGRYLGVPELVPFRLTRDMLDPMGVTGVEGVFRGTCHSTMQTLRQSSDTLLCIVSVLLHDPLANWAIAHNVATGGNAQEDSKEKNKWSERAISKMKDKLEGRSRTGNISSVQQQVAQLIVDATAQKNLACIYAGWAPFC